MGKIEDLIVDEEEIGEKLLYELLEKYIRIGEKSKSLIFNPEFDSLKIDDKIIVYLLGKKVLKLLNFSDEEKASPKDISNDTGINYDTIKPQISALARNKILGKEDRKYFVPNYNLNIIKERLENSAPE